ncbi:uncharacterized protein LOC143785642 [Ranitomeya variabilis]|uniref:uncharacterized protein LOC143785642 n=1 Tax=Ranitomeya variabilis TaxID=490064 RepID=UPI004055E64D
MDEVWILSLCLTLFGFFIFILSLKTKQEPEPESISKSCGSSASAYASSGGKSLEVGDDEVEKMMERLNKLLSGTEATKKEIQPERKKVVLEKQEDLPHRRADMESTNETQEPVGKVPGHTQPANQPSHHRVQERSAHAAVENIMDEIEQAVQETEESDYYARRRQERAAARAKQWTE